jgi:hypothetical protein
MNHLRNLALLAVTAGLVACGAGPELVDRTDPDYIKKSDLDGSWYFLETIVEVPPTTSLAFEGLQSGMDKIRFEIQEKQLVAYRVYEYVPGSDPQIDREKSYPGHIVYKDGRPYRGAPVAAWDISSHFDRQRVYNPATGQQSNQLEENSIDRPWFEREFVRVDWSTAKIANNFALINANEGGVAPLQSYLSRDTGTDKDDVVVTEYAETAGKKQLAYFDTTIRQYYDPVKQEYPGYGEIPYCWINPRYDCESALVKVRSSFKKIDEARMADYEPLKYDDRLQKKFGFFRTERVSYDRNRGVTETGRILLANRHNLWVRAHDEKGDIIPVEKREVRPVVYHLSTNFPKELIPAVRDLEKSWDTAFRRTVAVPRNQTVAQTNQVFFVCETPVPAGAPAACGKEGTSPRLGDLRFNIISWIDKPMLAGPLGYGPSSADPETGEIVQAGAYIYGAGLDAWTADAQVVLDVITKDLSIDELTAGKHVRDFISLNFQETDPRAPVAGPWVGQQKQPLDGSTPQKTMGAYGNIAGNLRAIIDSAKTSEGLPRFNSNRRAVVDKIISMNPELESALIDTPEVRSFVMSLAPGDTWRAKLESDPNLYRTVARQSLLRFDEIEKISKARQLRASLATVWLAEFSDDSMYGLAKEMADFFNKRKTELQAQGKSATEARTLAKAEVWTKLRVAGFRSVTEHEVGHTLGLMHNFIGSFDSMNYMPGYWDLRKQTLGVVVNGQRVLPTAPENLALATLPNQAQKDGKMRELQYSSIMDYGSRMNADVHGIGKYDEAAILFAYSGGGEPGYVEVFKELRNDYNDPNNLVPTDISGKQYTVRGAHVELAYSNLTHWTPASTYYSDRFHYTTLPFHFADKGLAFDAAVDQGLKRMQNRGFKKWSEMKVVYDDVESKMNEWFKAGGYYDTEHNWQEAQQVIGNSKARGAPVEVPYMYCSDYEEGANAACHKWDQGADLYEITSDWMTRYKDYYAFTNFKRDRFTFSPSTVLARNYDRLLGYFPTIYQNWLFDIYFYQSYYMANPPSGLTPQQVTAEWLEDNVGFADPITQNYMTMAVLDSTNLVLQQLATPSAGYYGKDKTTGRWTLLPDNNTQSTRLSVEAEAQLSAKVVTGTSNFTDIAYLPRGPGRSMYTLFANDGYDFYTRPTEVGHFWDQYAALMTITSSETNFLGVDRGADAFKYSLPYYMVFPKELSSMVGNVWSQRTDRYAANLVKTDAADRNLATVVPGNYVNGADLIYGFNYPAAPVNPVNPAATMDKVEPSPTWSTRFYTQLFGMAYFTDNSMLNFADQNQVFRLGSGESVTPATGFELVQFQDPFGGGYSYAALRKTGDLNPNAAAQMVLTATDYRTKWLAATLPADKALWEAKTREAVRSLEMMRGLYGVFGQP